MTQLEITREQLRALLTSAQDHWQKAADYAIRGLWSESGREQALAQLDLERIERSIVTRRA